jgi:DNA topoisomerase IA
LSEEEKQQLMKIAEKTMTAELEDELDSIDQEDIVLQTKIDDVKNKLAKDIDA